MSAASSGLRAELLMPSESSTIASTSRRGHLLRGDRDRSGERCRSAVGRERLQFLKILQRPGVLGEFDEAQVEIIFQFLPPFFDLPAGLIESRDAGRIVGNAHRRRSIEQKDQARLVAQIPFGNYKPDEKLASRPTKSPDFSAARAIATASV